MNSHASPLMVDFDKRAYRRLFLVVISLCVVGLLYSGYVAQDSLQFFLFTTAIFSMVVVLSPALLGRSFFPFEPITFVCFSVLMGLCLKTFYVILAFNTSIVVQDKLMVGLTIDDLAWSTTVLLIGLVMCVLGYLIFDKNIVFSKKGNSSLSEPRLLFFSVVVIAVSLAAFIIFVAVSNFSFSDVRDLSQKRFSTADGGRLSNINYYIYRVALFCKAPMYFLFFVIITRGRFRSIHGVLFILALMLNIAATFFVSNKAGVILPFADLTVIYFILTGRLDLKKLVFFGGLVFVLVSIVAVFRSGDGALGLTLFDHLFGGRYFIGVTKSAQIINAFPQQIDFFYGKTLISWLNVFLPDSLSTDDLYLTGLGKYLGFYVFGHTNSGVPPGIITEIYINFGLAGVVIGMFLIGAVLKRAHIYLFSRVNSVFYLIVYALVTVRLPTFLFNNGMSVTILKCLADIIIVWAFYILVKRISFTSYP